MPFYIKRIGAVATAHLFGLRSLDLLVLGFPTAVIGRSFSMICFFDFVTWLGHI